MARTPDPIDNIMNMLQGKGTVDPNQKAMRQAQMKEQRQQMGAHPGMAHPGQAPPAQDPAQQQQAHPGQAPPAQDPHQRQMGPEETGDGEKEIEDVDDVNLVTDQLNESIISMKRALHHTQDPQETQMWERRIESIRQQILEMGGEPVWADESIEEGLSKLKGRGYVGAERLAEQIRHDYGLEGDTDYQHAPGQHPRDLGGRDQRQRPYQQPGTERPGDVSGHTGTIKPIPPAEGDPEVEPIPPAEGDPEVEPIPPAEGRPEFMPHQEAEPTIPAEDEPTERHPADPDRRTELADPGEPTPDPTPIPEEAEPPTDYGGAWQEFEEWEERTQEVEPEDEVDEALMEIGEDLADEDDIVPPWEQEFEGPDIEEWQFDDQWVRGIIDEYDMAPMTDEEIQETAHDIVQRQAQDKKRVIQRDIDQFKREWPNEFERAKEEIKSAATEYKAAEREEFAGRGMLYSSVMAQATDAVDEAVIEEISEISQAATNYVMGLKDELRDVAEWAIVEEEALRRELAAEERDRATQLGQWRTNLAIQGQKYESDRAMKEAQFGLQQRQQALQEYQMQIEQYDREQQMAAMAGLTSAPHIKETLGRMGYNQEMLQQMDPTQRAYLAESAMDYAMTESQMLSEQLNRDYMALQMDLKQREHELNMRMTEKQMEEMATEDTVFTERDVGLLTSTAGDRRMLETQILPYVKEDPSRLNETADEETGTTNKELLETMLWELKESREYMETEGAQEILDPTINAIETALDNPTEENLAEAERQLGRTRTPVLGGGGSPPIGGTPTPAGPGEEVQQ